MPNPKVAERFPPLRGTEQQRVSAVGTGVPHPLPSLPVLTLQTPAHLQHRMVSLHCPHLGQLGEVGRDSPHPEPSPTCCQRGGKASVSVCICGVGRMREHEGGPPTMTMSPGKPTQVFTNHEEWLISLDIVLSRSKVPPHHLVILEVFLS